MKSISRLILSLAVVLVTPTTTIAAPLSWGNETLLSGSTNAWEPFIAADPNSSWVYATWFLPSGPAPCTGCATSNIRFSSSSDGGLHWNASTWFCPATCNSRGQYDPTIKVVPLNGTIYAMWMDWNTIMFSKSSDTGLTWAPQVQLSGNQWADHPWFGMSADGRDVYAFWAKGDIYGVASHDSGATWSAPKKINTDKNRQYYAEGVEVLATGEVVVAAASYPCSKGTSQCTGAVNITTFRSTNAGVGYTATQIEQLYTGPQWLSNTLETIAADSAGGLMLMYNGASTLGANNQMYARYSSNKGLSWGPRILLSTGPTAAASYPAIAGHTAGRFRAVYYDNRTGAYNVWYRETTDSGATWTPDVKISNLATGAPYKTTTGFGAPYGDYLGIAVLNTGQSIAVFGEAAPGQAAPGGIWMNRQQ